MKRRIVIAGGSGFLGRNLQRHLTAAGYEIIVLSRTQSGRGFVQWDAQTKGEWTKSIEGSHAVVNLVGRSVDCRYSRKNREQILSSRIESTHLLSQTIAACKLPPKIWLNSSTATIYRDTPGNQPANTEQDGVIGEDFSMNVAKAWEAEFFNEYLPSTTRTAMRVAIVLGNDGGAFPIMSKLARFGLCSPQGDGQQWISWIHVDDFCRAVKSLIENPKHGVVNICAPNPIQNADFNLILRQHQRPWIVLPQPKWLLEIGAFFIRTQTELILKSRKVAPANLIQRDFQWRFENAPAAISDLLVNS